MQLPYPVRILGLDLGITSVHRGVVVDGEGQVRARRSAVPTVDSLSVLEVAALQGAEPGTRLLVVVEPTGPAWLPIAVFFGRRGHLVVRVSSAKAADLRRFLSRHAKTNGIDAETLARLPLVAPESLEPVELPGAARATLDRRVRAVARLTARIGEHKTRIRALAAALIPTIGAALGSSLTRADLAVLARWGDPRAVSLRRLTATIDKASLGHSGEEKARAFHAAADQALALWDGDSAVALADVAAELATEIRLLHAAEIERAEHEAVRDAALAKVDPDGLAASVPGLGPVGTSVLTAAMGRPGRFPNAAAFKQFTGLAPRANQTGETDRKSQPMSKAGPRGLRSALIHCADTAGEDGVFRIARKVARDRVISTVDTEARHGHKSRARTFDGYKTHLSVDPDDELITNVAVTAANTADRDVLDDLLDEPAASSDDHDDDEDEGAAGAAGHTDANGTAGWQVYGDSAYADGQTLHDQAERGNDLRVKVPPVHNARGYSKDEFHIDPQAGTVGCPAGHTAPIRPLRRGGQARFGQWCGDCPLRAACTTARGGRVITIHPREADLQRAKARQHDPDWQRAYRTHRPTVERKISHFTRRPWGGRKARCRGQARVLTDVLTRAAAINLARLAALGLQHWSTGWVIA